MKLQHLFSTSLFVLAVGFTACNNGDTKTADEKATTATESTQPSIKEESVSYGTDSLPLDGFVAYDENKEGPRPAILVIPEWWGMTDYPKKRARQLAELGYIAFAVDMYGNGKVADNPDSATKYSTPFYSNPQMTKDRFDAALAKLKTYSQTDPTRIAAIGYCFGGAAVLNVARMGEDIKGVVSFHGNLVGVPLDKSKLKASILVCHGGADPFVKPAEVEQFKKDMDAAGISYTFRSYDGALHAFTNPEATALGKKFSMPIAYNPAADTASWGDMREFFGKIFQ